MDELDLAVKYPLGMSLTFKRTDRNAISTGVVNGAPMTTGDDDYVPVYVDEGGMIIYINTKNIMEDA